MYLTSSYFHATALIVTHVGTFIPPGVPDELFAARRNAPDAWGSEYSISAGWVSDVDLYKNIARSNSKKAPTLGLNAIFKGKAPISSSPCPALPVFSSGLPTVDACSLATVQGALQVRAVIK